MTSHQKRAIAALKRRAETMITLRAIVEQYPEESLHVIRMWMSRNRPSEQEIQLRDHFELKR